MKQVTLFKKELNDTVFLPQDFHIATFSSNYFKTVLNDSESRIFLTFDCFNIMNKVKLNYFFNVNEELFCKKTKNNEWKNELICLTSNITERNVFHKFFKVNFVNNKIKKFYSHFTIYLLKYLVDYLQLNVNFTTFTYKDLYETLIKLNDDNQLDFTDIEILEKDNEIINKSSDCCCSNKKNIYLSFSNEKIINLNFLDTRITEDEKINAANKKIESEMNNSVKSLAYKNEKLERKLKILQKRNAGLQSNIQSYKNFNNIYNLNLMNK